MKVVALTYLVAQLLRTQQSIPTTHVLTSTKMKFLHGIAHRTNDLLEHALGVRIRRTPRMKDVDEAVYRLRSWTADDVIFDVGAHDGRTILRLLKHLPQVRFYAFEPVSATFETLVERTSGVPNIRCFQQAMGAESGRREIYLKDISAVNSFYSDWGRSVGRETVDVTTVDQILEKHGIEMVHLLKIDAEGHDLEVLRGAKEALTSDRVGIIQVEINFKRPRLSLDQFRTFLEPMGYLVSGIYTQKRIPVEAPAAWQEEEKQRYSPHILRYCNAVFVNTNLRREHEPLPSEALASTPRRYS